MIPILYSYVSKNTHIARRGGVMGIASSSYILGNMIGPSIGGQIAAEVGLRANFFVTGGLLLLTLLLVRTIFIDMHGATVRSEEDSTFTGTNEARLAEAE